MSKVNHYSEIEDAILYMKQHLDDPLSLSHLARHISYSPYHFSRLFKQKTGLSPIYYVASLRMQKAKDLLLRTDLTIRDIGLEIGQQSLGTFTTRFTQRIGLSPSRFRKTAHEAPSHLEALSKLSNWSTSSINYVGEYADMTGTVSTSEPFKGIILIGLFPKPIPEGRPLYGTLILDRGNFRFTQVKPGRYYLMATSVSWGMTSIDYMLPYQTLRTRTKYPITVKPFSSIPHQDVMLYPPKLDDPPILISLPLLMKSFLSRLHI
ncbi:helix-turn-helix transcriptional regulator [Salipaludibacillus agaradhaerens]|jgi:AraC-like DNA-binding protein|uniref:Helix-turn-helix transcriptional regulator n=1 Tax=Salipaludibacillus agaradhaerens TaxID=76935 RepID=A0A9Q4B412_SALAG|nr:AraC family transcriptional regulator [Salipaludibacillus agaradhaerens]MCR6098003.1 helix-turn-helix transcriptional regulator [Salipaludibacillus agaradhaerens]MCR6116368.1 helix-turn-helix transcriptional regulator [Salipaludibacillus agaradhaerens]